MFPKADETIILDTLYNVDNNVLAATNQLQAMGFDKKDSTPSCAGTPSSKGKDPDRSVKNEKKEKVVPAPTPSARLRSVVEKQESKLLYVLEGSYFEGKDVHAFPFILQIFVSFKNILCFCSSFLNNCSA